jgi:hypothetical protein
LVDLSLKFDAITEGRVHKPGAVSEKLTALILKTK